MAAEVGVIAIAIVDAGAGVTLDDRARAAAALQVQSQRDFYPAWGAQAAVRAAAPGSPPAPGEWVAELRDSLTTDDGALAVHDVTPIGAVVIRVDVGACRRYGASWTSALSHEICEALADPLVRRGVQDDRGTWWALEVCDAVEADAYEIDGVEVSNFCLPAWGEPPADRSGARYDHLGSCRRPFEVRPGGYAQRWDPSRGWLQVGQMRPYRADIADAGGGRGAKRPRPWTLLRRLAAWWACVRRYYGW